MNNLGDFIRSSRVKNGMSQKTLASLSGCGRRLIGHIEANSSNHIPSDALADRLSQSLNVNRDEIERLCRKARMKDAPKGDDISQFILNKLQIHKNKVGVKPYTMIDLANIVDCAPGRVEEAVHKLKLEGYNIHLADHNVQINPPATMGTVKIPMESFYDGIWVRLGVVSDTHLCNKNSRVDALNAAYDVFEKEGIRKVFHGGNWIDGEFHFNKMEMVTPPGIGHQVNYFLDNYPQRPGIDTHIISGDDHEGWYAQREGLDPGWVLEKKARDRGRTDIHNLGYSEVDIPFMAKEGSKPAILRLVHPGGGTAYAISYSPQKMVESYGGGELPNIVIFGHWHKSDYFNYREVAILQAGTLCRQTLFMRKKKIPAHVGFWIMEFQVSKDGLVSRVRPEWFPVLESGYYTNRYSIGEVQREKVA